MGVIAGLNQEFSMLWERKIDLEWITRSHLMPFIDKISIYMQDFLSWPFCFFVFFPPVVSCFTS